MKERDERASVLAAGCAEIPSCAGTCANALKVATSQRSSPKEREQAMIGCSPEAPASFTAGDRIERHVVAYAQGVLSSNVLDGKTADTVRSALSKIHQPSLILDTRGISLDSDPHALVPPPSDPALGADATYKRSGANDLYLVPVGDALKREIAAGRLPLRLRFVVDEKTPYRTFLEAFSTAEASGLTAFEICEGNCSQRRVEILARAHDATPASATPAAPRMNLVANVGSGGIALKIRNMNIAPSCADPGAGVTIPRVGGANDLGSLTRCIAKVRAVDPAYESEDTATVRATSTTTMHEIVDVAVALQGPSKTWFTHFTFDRP